MFIVFDAILDPSATKGQVALTCTDLAACAIDVVAGVTCALPQSPEPVTMAGRAVVVYVATGGSAGLQLAGLIVYWSTDQDNSDAVVLYPALNYGGESQGFGVGSYDYGDLGKVGNDKALSIQVLKGFRATLYEHGGWTGNTLILDNERPDLGTFKNTMSSLNVTRI